ncbi:7-carboxy-7-deazaguanine synthase QueE [Saccharicrinis sp. FJH62]|uniref:7-carboxy-7-deazaguanine synthase QueE n=1 Tax=Saccharicrinis sp. FJH62 TaxID=3344657 RepID=UPI0035D45A79
MSQLFLAPEGIFPATKDAAGNPIKKKPATGFTIPGTIQGEGKMAGLPALFLRLSGCNLRCMWNLPNGDISICDTPHASFSTDFETLENTEDVARKIIYNLGNIPLLVISGGEPLIQANGLMDLIKHLRSEKPDIKIAIETNGTIFNEKLADLIDFFSISPKLKNALPTLEKVKKAGIVLPADPDNYKMIQINIRVLQDYIDLCKNSLEKDFQLKFVISSENETNEIKDQYLDRLTGWKSEDIVLMPLGSTPEELAQTRLMAMETAIKNGFRYTPRLQVTYFDGIAGV